MADIRAALATYDLAMAGFDEACEEGEPLAKDYEYRDDDAVAFAAEASEWIRAALEALEPAQIKKVERRLAIRQQGNPPQSGAEQEQDQ